MNAEVPTGAIGHSAHDDPPTIYSENASEIIRNGPADRASRPPTRVRRHARTSEELNRGIVLVSCMLVHKASRQPG